MRFRFLLFILLVTLASAHDLKTEEDNSFAVQGEDGEIPFFTYTPTLAHLPLGVLLLIPGHNGSGTSMLDERWRHFADEHQLVLLAPTFTSSNPVELHHHQGYYYPELGSGKVIEEALVQAHQRTGVPIAKILIFGFSAGAHLAHRFALWKPERVGAFVAYSAGWWSDPTPALAHVPSLIMCGEDDPRYLPTREFMEKGMALHLPLIWRSYKNTGHQLTPAVRSMAESFLAYEATQLQTGPHQGSPSTLYGDLQTYHVVPASQRDTIPEAVRITLPSQEIADTWMKEK